ncbi:MAG: polysaccharide deacetylase family protein, partial [Bacteroidales bacterium]|nr:polysaccharide deacetylase family protein [Bacteroidales bacterium]
MDKHGNKFLLIIIAFLLSNTIAQSQESGGPAVRVAKYKDDKACAVSYTFDDGLKDQYELAVPMLDEFNFKGTFWLVGSRITESSEEDLLLNKKNGRIT